MKKIFYFLFFAMALVSFVSQVQGVEWKYIDIDFSGTEWFYDRETLTKLPNGIFKVWVKQVYSDKGRIINIQQRIKRNLSTNNYEILAHSMVLYEINCATRECRIPALSDYSFDGSVLDSVTLTKTNWKPITPETMGDALRITICPPK